ncbi:MAG: aspartate aminotransferase family protein [Caldilineaceae bacterium]|nr:aspartate aminotransferase family protein [Caldilineaceae bacterium]MCB9140331.1 aspartate aminotransferase family protein [Caldilineaceae bacterium]
MTATLEHATLVEQDKHQLHGLHHPERHSNPFVVEHAEGVWLYGDDDRKVLDAMAGLWNVNVGYGSEELARVAYEQMKKLAYTSGFAGMTNVPSAQLADKLAGMAHPTLNSIYFTSGGSESNETAFKTVLYYWRQMGKPEKRTIISRQQAYHGITMAATSATGLDKYWKMFGLPLSGFVHIDAPNAYRFTGSVHDGESLADAAARALEEKILSEGPETVAAFIAEPIQGAGGLVVPPAGYFARVREICDRYDVLLIIDEVITGFGRTGTMFAVEHENLRPDILCFAKGVTSGYIPLGGIMVSDAIRAVIDNAPEEMAWNHGFTYSGHAAACAVGLRNVEMIEEQGLVENSRIMGDRLRTGLESLREFRQVDNVRGRGLLNGLELVKDRESREPDADLAGQVCTMAMAAGLRVRPLGNTIAFSPPLTINADEVDQIVDILGGVLDRI